VSNQAWWRIVVVISSLSIGAAAVACCYLLRSEPEAKYEHVIRDNFIGRFNRETGEMERISVTDSRITPQPSGSGFTKDANGKYPWDYAPVVANGTK